MINDILGMGMSFVTIFFFYRVGVCLALFALLAPYVDQIKTVQFIGILSISKQAYTDF